ncbi:hypothetical protein B0H14DRAFT_3023551 [Mycena olivaceomarginata]|nr:hypothetical protein B0H14DRAFT_3023551 [Mycena olivaceomarginata]
MHRCLQLPELVGLVCSHLQSPYHLEIALEVRQPKRGDLAVLARTSTVFSSHALRLLWESVTLIYLLRCEGYFTKYMMQLLRPLRASDWERVLVYAQLVKHLSSDPDFADLSPVFPSISKKHAPKPPGPALDAPRERTFSTLTASSPPSLTTIRIPHTSLDALSLLSSLALRCAPDLQPLAVSAVSICVRGLHGIETLITDMVDEPALEHLSRLSGVRHLRLGELPPHFACRSQRTTWRYSPSLQTLYFSSEIESPTRFLEWGNKLPLVEFTAECPAFSTADEVHHLFSAASGGISHLPLTGFAFDNEFGSLDSSFSANYLIRPHSLRSLFCFVNLTSVSILSAVGIDLDDTTCLEAFPKYCPHLTKLSITFDATVIPTSQADLSLACLKNLDHSQFARFLARMFPSLKNISTLRDSLDGEDEWEEGRGTGSPPV